MGSKPSSFAVYKNDYDELVPQDMRKDWGRFHYTWAIRNVIGAIDKWRPYHGIEKPIEYIFDWEKPGTEPRKEIEDVMEQAEEISGRLGLYTNYTFHKRHYSRVFTVWIRLDGFHIRLRLMFFVRSRWCRMRKWEAGL